MRTLVFGGTGMLGRAVVREGRRRGWAILALSREEADVRDAAVLRRAAAAFRPAAILNCAAWTRVDECEGDTDRAFAVNGEAVGHAAAAAGAVGAQLLQVSTDYVFDGRATEPYSEAAPDSQLVPLSVYGKSKLLGEQRARAYAASLVVRTSWLFGPGGPNFARTIVDLLDSGRSPLRVVGDQRGCPTYTPFLAAALLDLAARRVRGVIHYRNREAVSWHGFASEIARQWGSAAEIREVTTAEFPRPAPRPAWSVLDVARCERALGRRVEPWIWGLAEYLMALQREKGRL